MSKNAKIALVIGGLALVAWFLFRYQIQRAISSVTSLVRPVNPAPQPFGGPPIAYVSQRPGPPTAPIPGAVGSILKGLQTGTSAAADIANNLDTTISDVENIFNFGN
jgi:hypothetical protein